MFKNKNKNLTTVIKKLEKTFHSKSYFTRFRGLISIILRKIVGLLLPSPTEILDLPTLPVPNDFFQDYDKNHEDEAVSRILIKDSYFPISHALLSEKC